MTTHFDPIRVGNIELDNRVIMAPMTRGRADDAGVQPAYAAEYYRQRASAGLIITEATNISQMAKGYIRTPGIYAAEQVEGWRRITDAVHARGGKISLQVFHTGRIALPDFLPGGAQPVAPSAVKAGGQNYTDEGMKDFVTPLELTTDEVKQTVQDFAAAARNAIDAGFDGVELHGANGYLVADAIVYGKLFLANPDLPERFERNAPLNEPDQSTFYTPGEKGYTDYPTFERAAAA